VATHCSLALYRLGFGPVRRGWDDGKGDQKVISVTVADRPAVP